MSADSEEALGPKLILVTGANGFVGRHALRMLLEAGYRLRAAVRRQPAERVAGVDYFECGSIDASTDWSHIVPGVDCIVHLAAHVHVMHAGPEDQGIFRRVNVNGSLCLAQAAARHAVKRFIYISSIKVNGEDSGQGAFSADDPACPQDDYARSKAETEKALFDNFHNGDPQIVVIRPPLVYGEGARGNLRALRRAIELHVPLPFASLRNCRSLVAVRNLCDLIRVCCEHPSAPGEVFLVSDNHDLSTPSLIALMASAMHRRAILIPCPPVILRRLSRLPFLKTRMRRLLGNLRVDIEKTRRLLGWSPPYAPDEDARAMMSET